MSRTLVLTILALVPAVVPALAAQSRRGPVLDPSGADAPSVYERNGGRYPPAVDFVARGPGFVQFLTRDAGWLVLREADVPVERQRALVLRTRLVGARADSRMAGRGVAATRVHHLVGDEPGRWSVDNTTFAEVVHRRVWDGIDMVHLRAGGRLRYDFLVAPGADPRRIELAFDGIDGCRIAADGTLVLDTVLGAITHSAPVLYQFDAEGHRTPVGGRFELRGEGRVGFEVTGRDATRTLVIDPVLGWSSYLGGSGVDEVHGVAVAPNGDVLAVGETFSTDLPTTPGVFQAAQIGSHDAFVGRLRAAGDAFAWCTYLGGNTNPFGAFTIRDIANGVALRSDGTVVVVGSTNTGDFPVTPGAHQGSLYRTSDSKDGFVTVLAADGASLVWSTYFGGPSFQEEALGVAVGPGDDVYVTGNTYGAFPTTAGAWLTSSSGTQPEAWAARFRHDGTRLWSTLLGSAGASADFAYDIDVDAAGRAYVAGVTFAAMLPAPNGFATSSHGGRDAFLHRLSADGSTLEYGTFIGDTGNQFELYPPGLDALDDGRVWFTTYADNATFQATPGVFQVASAGQDDAVLLCIDTSRSGGASLRWATYVGGSLQDWGRDVVVAGDGRCTLTGQTLSDDFPTAGAPKPCRTGRDVFVASFDAQGGLLWSTFFGGRGWEPLRYDGLSTCIAGDPTGRVAVGGNTDSPDLATPGAAQGVLRGARMGFVAALDPGHAVQARAMVRGACTAGAVIPQSIAAVDPRPVLGFPFRAAIDDPTGAANLPPNASFAFWMFSPLPTVSHPCGPTFAGYGPGGSPGELLIEMFAVTAVNTPPVIWRGPGQATTHTIRVPCDVRLAGRTVYTQAFFIDTGSRVVFGEAMELLLGS